MKANIFGTNHEGVFEYNSEELPAMMILQQKHSENQYFTTNKSKTDTSNCTQRKNGNATKLHRKKCDSSLNAMSSVQNLFQCS